MDTKKALNYFFVRLNDKSKELTRKNQICKYNEKGEDLYVSEKDEEGFVEWIPKNANPIINNTLPHDLYEFYSAFYYGEFYGRIKTNHFYFSAIYNLEQAEKAAKHSKKLGKRFFPKEDIYIIASAVNEKNENLMLCLNGDDEMLFLYDENSDTRYQLRLTLEGFFYKLKPLE